MNTCAVRGAARKITGHYRGPGTPDLYCGNPSGAQKGSFATVTGWKLCARYVKTEALDRTAATATAEAWLDTRPTAPLTAAEAGTWRAEWTGIRTRAIAPTLFDVDPDTEQGTLFA
ncbi:hypothetical protein [Streptomyces sp. NPDC004685]